MKRPGCGGRDNQEVQENSQYALGDALAGRVMRVISESPSLPKGGDDKIG